ncbi:MAG: metal-dependent hydrolase [Thermococcus sp.]|uniref:metal-dependent hydrolase n=1 Tax=Thermococcus sp. TaxID=35749 RepID=UPI001D495522|nr:metal-dependent hydrolase [Thermococcus sp.]MBO8174225.1 metal-dependent hydrolase [Thermococcus sp.]
MMWYTHAVFGALFALLIQLVGTKLGVLSFNELYVGIAAFGALLPDVDHPKSYISMKLPFSNVVSSIILEHTKHRGVTHTIEAGVIISIITGIIISYFFGLSLGMSVIFLFVGYTSHLFADSLTVSGVRWSKFSNFKLSWKIKTGTLSEGLILVPTVFSTVVLYFYLSNPKVKTDIMGLFLAALLLTYVLVGRKAGKLFRNQTIVAKKTKRRRKH